MIRAMRSKILKFNAFSPVWHPPKHGHCKRRPLGSVPPSRWALDPSSRGQVDRGGAPTTISGISGNCLLGNGIATILSRPDCGKQVDLQAHTGPVSGLSWNSDGRLATASEEDET